MEEYEQILNDLEVGKEFHQEIMECSSDVRGELFSLAESIEMLGWLMKAPSERGYAKDKETDVEGKIKVDINKPHVLEDMDYFRQTAIHFQKHGKYTNLYPNPHPNSEYKKFWNEEKRRCLKGYIRESDGEWIPGYYYWYLNYSPINRTVDILDAQGNTTKRGGREYEFPDVWDSDYLFFHYVEQAEELGLFGTVLKTRGRGYSFKTASMLARNFFLMPKSKSFAFASDTEYLIDDGLLRNKTWDVLDWVDQHTAWTKGRLTNSVEQKKAGYVDPKDKKEKGYKSEIIGVTTGGNPEKGRGKRGKLLVYEEGGMFPHLLKTWVIARPSMEDGPTTFGFMMAFGTGGTVGANFEGLEELFYRGRAYRVHMIRNVYDKVKGNGECAFFVPEYMNRRHCYDNNGNSNAVKALIQILEARKIVRDNSSKPEALTQEKAERPCISKNTLISNTSIGSDKIINLPNHFSNGIHELFELKTIQGRTLECTKDHKIYDGNIYKEADLYDIKDRIKLKPFIPNKNYQEVNIQGNLKFQNYNIKINEDFACMLGLYMGDGCFYNNSLEFKFDARDKSSYEWLISYFNKNFKTPIIKVISKNQICIQLHSKELKEIFIQLDLIKKWNGNKHGYKRKIHIPDYIIKSPKSVIASFLKGYFDADSGIYTKAKTIKIYSKEIKILEQCQILLSSFDIYCKIKHEKKVNNNGGFYYGNSIVFRSWEVDKFKEIGFLSTRKQDLLNKWCLKINKCTDKNYGYDFISSFKSLGFQQVYDIETKERCYSANGIWAHNCTPQESVLRFEGTIFPVADLKTYLEDISPMLDSFLSEHLIGDLVFDSHNGEVRFKPNADATVLREFPIKDNKNKEGAFELFKLPIKNGVGEIARKRYIAGIDTYDDDESGTNSLGSIFVMDMLTDEIVAEYTGRPQTANKFYENCLKLLKFYNAEACYESNKKGLFAYFAQRHCLSYLTDVPEILKDMQMIKGTNLGGNKQKGVNANPKVNAWGRRLQADYMLSPVAGYEETGLMQLQRLRSITYIKEAIGWNEDGNFDRVSAMGMLMIQREEYKKYVFGVREEYEGEARRYAGDDPFFQINYKKDRGDMKNDMIKSILKENKKQFNLNEI